METAIVAQAADYACSAAEELLVATLLGTMMTVRGRPGIAD